MSIRQHDFTIERQFRQTPSQAFRAFADSELKRRWFGVLGGWTDAEWELDFRVGGSEVSVGRDPDGSARRGPVRAVRAANDARHGRPTWSPAYARSGRGCGRRRSF